jgi:hypothetical protein
METAIVTWDPRGELPEGEIIESTERLRLLRNAGVLLMPADPDLCSRGGARGYFRRGWGSGWLFDGMRPVHGCPLLLLVEPERTELYWSLLVAPDRGCEMSGALRLMADNNQPLTAHAGLFNTGAVADLALHQPLDESGRVLVRGRTRISVSKAGYLPLCLYGVAKAARVLWIAATQSRQDISAW